MPKVVSYCKVEGCGREHYAKGYCQKHYDNFRRTQNPLGTRYVKGRRKEALLMKARGDTYSTIGESFGISRQRVQQIVAPTSKERKAVYRKLGERCHFCNVSESENGREIDLHHVVYKRKRIKLLPVCIGCHRKIDNIVGII